MSSEKVEPADNLNRYTHLDHPFEFANRSERIAIPELINAVSGISFVGLFKASNGACGITLRKRNHSPGLIHVIGLADDALNPTNQCIGKIEIPGAQIRLNQVRERRSVHRVAFNHRLQQFS